MELVIIIIVIWAIFRIAKGVNSYSSEQRKIDMEEFKRKKLKEWADEEIKKYKHDTLTKWENEWKSSKNYLEQENYLLQLRATNKKLKKEILENE